MTTMDAVNRIILDLCGGTGAWSEPYRKAGYNVKVIDPEVSVYTDVRLFEYIGNVHGVLAAPPCTHFSSSGARWWRKKGDGALLDGLSVVDACIRIAHAVRPTWFALENPVGRLRRYLGDPVMTFDPCDYAGWDGGEDELYTKKTLLWGWFTKPGKRRREPVGKNPIHHASPGPDRWRLRSKTPTGFANAFFAVNP